MYKITEGNAAEIREKMKEIRKTAVNRRLLAVALRGEGKKNEEIAEITGFHSDWVSRLSKIYCIEGIDGLIEDRRKGGNNRNMNEIDAADFLEGFQRRIEKGQTITIKEIAKAYDEALGKEHKSLSSAYYFLHTHGQGFALKNGI